MTGSFQRPPAPRLGPILHNFILKRPPARSQVELGEPVLLQGFWWRPGVTGRWNWGGAQGLIRSTASVTVDPDKHDNLGDGQESRASIRGAPVEERVQCSTLFHRFPLPVPP